MTYTQVWDTENNKVSDRIVIRDEDGAFIPFDFSNLDYRIYRHWLSQGNRPNPSPYRPMEEQNDGS